MFLKRNYKMKFLAVVLFFIASVNNFAYSQSYPVRAVITDEKVVAFTFDDGPYPELTEKFLDYLAKENVKATFFNMGKHMFKFPELTKRLLEEGHELGNHTVNHLHLPEIKNDEIINCEIKEFQFFAKEKFDYEPKVFRAPYLQYDNRVNRVLNELDLISVDGAVYAKDGPANIPADSVYSRISKGIKPGVVVLAHEREATLTAIKKIVPELKKQGYRFVTVSRLLEEKNRGKFISPNDSRIHFTGAKFSRISAEMINFQRHSDSVLALPQSESFFNSEKAKTTSGTVLSFKTASPFIKVFFEKLPGVNRTGLFTIYRNRKEIGSFTINAYADSSFVINIIPNTTGEALYDIALPTFNNLAFTGMEIAPSYDLIEYAPEQKPIYVAYGNSITHGAGQIGTSQTYAYKTARKFGWELYNVAVGGAKTSSAIAAMLRDDFERIDYMTILIGYNDYNSQGIDTTEYKTRLTKVLNAIRQTHAKTEIFCISQTFTLQETSRTSGLPIEDFRTALANFVAERKSHGDEHIYLIKGEEITDSGNLTDRVHFSVKGAEKFADSLAVKIAELLNSTDENNARRKN